MEKDDRHGDPCESSLPQTCCALSFFPCQFPLGPRIMRLVMPDPLTIATIGPAKRMADLFEINANRLAPI